MRKPMLIILSLSVLMTAAGCASPRIKLFPARRTRCKNSLSKARRPKKFS